MAKEPWTMPHPEHTDDCRCMFRLCEVAGELHVREDVRQDPELFTPAPAAFPLTGVFPAAIDPPTVIVSDLLADILPAGLAADVMLLGETGQREIPLTEADFEEIADILVPREEATARWREEIPSWRLSTGTVFRP